MSNCLAACLVFQLRSLFPLFHIVLSVLPARHPALPPVALLLAPRAWYVLSVFGYHTLSRIFLCNSARWVLSTSMELLPRIKLLQTPYGGKRQHNLYCFLLWHFHSWAACVSVKQHWQQTHADGSTIAPLFSRTCQELLLFSTENESLMMAKQF